MDWYLPLIFFLVALLYASAGFGGGSTYLAILSLVFTDFYEIRSIALVLNLFVVSVSTVIFIRSGLFDWKRTWPFIILSIPLALLAATLRLQQSTFFILLGVALIFASGMMIVQTYLLAKDRFLSNSGKVALGGIIGAFSGLTGIGGGIYLSPTLNLMGWANARIITSIASFFILCNSIAGISGLLIADTFRIDFIKVGGIIVAVALGGIAGGYLTSRFIDPKVIRIITAVLIAAVGIRLISKYLLQ